MTVTLGMRGNGDWVDGQRPKNWRETILYLYPNGSVPLTGILSQMGKERTTDPEFNWWTKTLATQGGAVTNVYTDAAMTSAYVDSGVTGTTLYIKTAEATASEFRAGHQALLRYSSDLDVDVNVKVTGVILNGESSQISCKLLEADDNSASYDLSDCDRILVVGNINAEGASMPSAISYDPVKWYNYTQIFRTPLSITRTARKTRVRTGDTYKEMKREALEIHGIEQEKAWLFGIRSENTGDNGQPERTTGGIIAATKDGGVTGNYVTDTNYAADAWLTSGEAWLDSKLEEIFRYGGEKLAFIGSGTALAINRLAKSSGQIQLQPTTIAYGLKVMEWITPFGTIYLKLHPLFSYDPTTRNSMLVFEPKNLKYRFIDDTQFIDRSSSNTLDATNEEFLTEAGLEYHHPVGWGWLNGFGQLNTVSE
jgi:hypothetical protein